MSGFDAYGTVRIASGNDNGEVIQCSQIDQLPGKYDLINGISKRNPKRAMYMNAAKQWLTESGLEL